MTLFYRFCRRLCIIFCRGYLRLKTWNLDRVPTTGGVILASNHQCYLDPPLATCLIRRQCNYLARSTLFRFAPFAWLIRNVGAVPLERGESDAAGLRRAVDILRAGHLLMLFPEGTRTRDGALGRVQSGVAVIAMRSGVPVVPTFIHGAYDAWPRSQRFPRPRRVGVFYGAPIQPPAETEDRRGHKEQVRKLTAEIQAGLEALQRQAFETMPLKGRSVPKTVRNGDGKDGPLPGDPPTTGGQSTDGAPCGAAPEVNGNRLEVGSRG
ncbi:MAG TPA: lysophospholipid acyltransferase family protein [Planctomycetota bacterium]|nr:lysophospholipid acyltransferase family protein [Planctomycetota bacterium]